MTLWPHIWHRNQHKSFSLIDKYCKYLIPKIDLLYFSSNIMKSSVFFSRHSVRVQLWIHSVPLHYLPCCLFVKKSVIVTKNSATLVQKLFAQPLTIIDKGWRRSIFGTFVHCYYVHCRCLLRQRICLAYRKMAYGWNRRNGRRFLKNNLKTHLKMDSEWSQQGNNRNFTTHSHFKDLSLLKGSQCTLQVSIANSGITREDLTNSIYYVFLPNFVSQIPECSCAYYASDPIPACTLCMSFIKVIIIGAVFSCWRISRRWIREYNPM